MQVITNLIEKQLGLSAVLQAQIFSTIFIIVIMAIVYNFAKKLLYRTIKDSKIYYRTKKIIGYLFVAVAFILIGRVWFQGVQSLTTFLGLFSAGLAIAMKDIVMNIAGWGYIVWKSPFSIGDRCCLIIKFYNKTPLFFLIFIIKFYNFSISYLF